MVGYDGFYSVINSYPISYAVIYPQVLWCNLCFLCPRCHTLIIFALIRLPILSLIEDWANKRLAS